MVEKALADVKVLDLTRYLAGPYCTKLLADRGAEVVKIERPGAGDPARNLGPFPGDEPHLEKSGLSFYLNTNKKSVTLDFQSPEGLRTLKELAWEADVVVESFSPGTMTRLGLDYHVLAKENPRLVMTSISNFGATGPYRDYQASHLVLCALSGWLYSTGEPDREPLQVGGWISHYIAGLHAAFGTMAALHWARETGEGQWVDVSAHEAMISTGRSFQLLWQSYGGRYRKREGNVLVAGTGLICPCNDGYIAVNLLHQEHWELFTRFMERPELEDPKFLTPLLRREHILELTDLVLPMFRNREHDEVFHSGQAWRIPFGLVPSAAEVLESEQYKARDFLVEVEHPFMGRVTVPGAPCVMSDSPWGIQTAAPLLGEQNDEILGAAKLSRGKNIAPRKGGKTFPSSDGQQSSELPLEGLRILDLSAYLSGPYATALLADMGAEVIKIESIQRYDGYRLFSPLEPGNIEKSSHYNWCNHGKIGITLDLTRPRGVEIFKSLASISDAVVENFSTRVMANFGLDYSVLKEINPRIIMLSMPCFGTTGPWKDYVGFAHVFEEMSGVVYLTGYADGPPLVSAIGYADSNSGLNGVFALLTALHQRRRTGKGQFIDLSQTEALTCLIGEVILDYCINKRSQGRRGNRHPFIAPQGCYRCRGEDTWIAITVASDSQWEKLRLLMGNPNWAEDERFSTVEGRLRFQDEMDKHLEKWTAGKDRFELMHLLQREGIAAGPMLLLQDLLKDPHLNQRGFYTMVDRDMVGTHPHSCLATKLSRTPGRIIRPAPLLGEHNELVLGELLGMSGEEIARLEEDGIIGKQPLHPVSASQV